MLLLASRAAKIVVSVEFIVYLVSLLLTFVSNLASVYLTIFFSKYNAEIQTQFVFVKLVYLDKSCDTPFSSTSFKLKIYDACNVH